MDTMERAKNDYAAQIRLCDRALSAIDEAVMHLEKARKWSTWDLWCGNGGLCVHWTKMDHLESAQEALNRAQADLQALHTSQAVPDVTIKGFLHTADWLLDGLFVDWTVREQIDGSLAQVESTRRELQYLRDDLARRCSTVQR